ncbi:hypothetical protein GOV14_03215 [Candidatus Pacearchaeota archaeon]|nr:hypothetical protein [Candidatus Pacearchaeota archaeon]
MPEFNESLNYLDFLATQVGLEPKKFESEQHFRQRVFRAYVDSGGGAAEALMALTGKDANDFTDEERNMEVALGIEMNKARNEKYEIQNDTHLMLTWKDFEDIMSGNKFEKDYTETFQGRYSPEELSIWTQKDKGLLLIAGSHTGTEKSACELQLHYELALQRPKLEMGNDESHAMHQLTLDAGYDHGKDKDGKIMALCCSRDSRKGLIEHIQKIDESPFETNNPWKYFKDHDLFLLNYHEKGTKANIKNRKVITNAKLQNLPENVKEMIGFYDKSE